MKDRARQAEYDEEQYHASDFLKSSSNKRLDLNDLLQRAKDQKKSDKKLNILIYSGAVSVVAVFVILLSL
tara:strand:+ start:925 stop:1134 length:210 start_codon:yes stop_codon:yes gene_type:complete